METLLVLHGAAVLVTAAAAITDARTGHIPNWLTLPPLVVGPVLHGLVDGVWGLGLSMAAILFCGLVPYLLFRRDAMGGGDVKLFAAIGALTGPVVGLEAQLLALVAASVWALGRLTWRGRLFQTLRNALFIAVNPVLPKRWRREISTELLEAIRLGGPIFTGTLFAVLSHFPLLPL